MSELMRRFPNELSALMIDNLLNDLDTLRNVALVCKDFAHLTRAHIFREINLRVVRGNHSLVERFMDRLCDPHATSSIKDLLQTLHVPSFYYPDETTKILQIFLSLTTITLAWPTPEHLQIIETNFGGTLRELWVDGLCHRVEDVLVFQRMLTSLVVLETLVIDNARWPSVEDTEDQAENILILPKSLKFVSLHVVEFNLLHAIGKGLKLQPVMLHAIFLQLNPTSFVYNNVNNSHPQFWAGLGLRIPVVLVVSPNDSIYYSGSQFALGCLANRMRGLKVTRIMCLCSPGHALATFFTRLLPILPESISRICIDIDASSSHIIRVRLPDSVSKAKLTLEGSYWRSLDRALCQRYDEGLLEHVYIRCTMRAPPFGFLSTQKHGTIDRSILNRIEKELQESTNLGFIRVDHTTMFFKPTM